MDKLKFLLFPMLICSVVFVGCNTDDDDDDDDSNNNLPTVSFTVSGAVSDDVQYSNTTTHSLQGAQGTGFMTFNGMGPDYSFSITVTADDVAAGTYDATQGQYINNANGTQTFGELSSGQVEISSVSEVSAGGSTANRAAGSFSMSVADSGGGGSVQISGTFSNVTVLQ